MARYNVGDRVVVREGLGTCSSNYAYGYGGGMEQYNGRTVTIASAMSDTLGRVVYQIEEDNRQWMWGDSDFVDDSSTPVAQHATFTKANLKDAWGQYCDTDKLVDDVMALLTKYNHRNSEHGVCTMLNEYFTNKKDLIELLQKSEHYMGDMRMMIDIELARENSASDVFELCNVFPVNVKADKVIIKYKDEKGKALEDYLRIGTKSIKARDLMHKETVALLKTASDNQSKFASNGMTQASLDAYNKFVQAVQTFGRAPSPTIEADVTSKFLPEYNIHEGMKTSRAFNRMCGFYGVDKSPTYNKLFAQYADMVSGLKRKLKFFISVNPIDYLTMSFGVNWASCHTIDKENRRHMGNSYHGMYCAGTVSYMLDATSIITFVHDHVPTDWEDGKIYRCMFHYGQNILVQGRVYPQGNDGNTDLYKVFRNYVQNEITPLIGITDTTWTKKTSGDVAGNVSSCGLHYKDYVQFSYCNVSYPRERSLAKDNVIMIGHTGICPYCGREFSADKGAISHANCVI